MTATPTIQPHIAIVRFSALGDVVMVAAAVQALRYTLPAAKITWITSPLAHSLLEGMTGVNFVVIDKPRGWADYRAFYHKFHHQRFDVVLAMQANLRINLLYPALHAPLKIGFDRTRARELQWLFSNRRIPFRDTHLVESFLSFVELLTGRPAQARWALPIGEADHLWAREQLQGLPAQLVAIHPHASKTERNWLPERYTSVITHLLARHDCSILLTGGKTIAELKLCEQLASIAPHRIQNLCGLTTPKQLAALLGEADVLLAPDTGAVHIARAMGTAVVGLYAVASSGLSGPYQHTEYCVDRFPQAVHQFLKKDFVHLPWNTRVHHPDAMSLIGVDEVISQLEHALKDAS